MNKINFKKHYQDHFRCGDNFISEFLKNNDHFSLLNKPITSVPDIEFIKKVATMIIHGMPLPTLKFYYEFEKSSTSWKVKSLNKSSEEIFKALICLYRPECVNSKSNTTVYLPVDEAHFTFSSCLDRRTHMLTCRKLAEDDKQYSVDQLEWFQSYIKNAQIRIMTFNSKEIADAYNEISI